MEIEVKENLKGLMYDIEVACIQYGMATEVYQQRAIHADHLQEVSDRWGAASKNLYDYLESL